MSERVLLGCGVPGEIRICYCTGRCKRTAEEQEAYEQQQHGFVGLLSRAQTQAIAISAVPRSILFPVQLPPAEPIPTEDES